MCFCVCALWPVSHQESGMHWVTKISWSVSTQWAAHDHGGVCIVTCWQICIQFVALWPQHSSSKAGNTIMLYVLWLFSRIWTFIGYIISFSSLFVNFLFWPCVVDYLLDFEHTLNNFSTVTAIVLSSQFFSVLLWLLVITRWHNEFANCTSSLIEPAICRTRGETCMCYGI